MGTLYLGSNKVCPAMVVGGGSTNQNTVVKFGDDVTNISQNQQFSGTFQSFPYSIDFDFNNVEVISGQSAFSGCFRSATGGSVSIKKLRVVSGYLAMSSTFWGSSQDLDIDFSTIEELSGGSCMNACFYDCQGVPEEISFDSLTSLNSMALTMCFVSSTVKVLYFPSLTSQSFGEYTDQFYGMLYLDENCVVHFPSNLQSVIGSWDDVVIGFHGTNTTVLFDLPATS